MSLRIERARPEDAELILEFVRELAEYEKLSHEVDATAEELRRTLFEDGYASVLIARSDGKPAGFALFFHNYSTFLARPGIYVEDLFVRPEFRGQGIGRALLAEIARIAVAKKCGRLEWSVLDWNAPAVAFYEKLGARAMSEWTVYRLTGEPLASLARERQDQPAPRAR